MRSSHVALMAAVAIAMTANNAEAGRRRHGSGGSSGGSYGSYGSCGSSGHHASHGSWGSHGSCGSSGGSYGSYGSCGSSGHQVVICCPKPCPPPPCPPKPCPSCPPTTTPTSTCPGGVCPAVTTSTPAAGVASDRAQLVLSVPAGADVYLVNQKLVNQKMASQGAVRRCSSTVLKEGATFGYPIRVDVVINGQKYSTSAKQLIRRGDVVELVAELKDGRFELTQKAGQSNVLALQPIAPETRVASK